MTDRWTKTRVADRAMWRTNGEYAPGCFRASPAHYSAPARARRWKYATARTTTATAKPTKPERLIAMNSTQTRTETVSAALTRCVSAARLPEWSATDWIATTALLRCTLSHLKTATVSTKIATAWQTTAATGTKTDTARRQRSLRARTSCASMRRRTAMISTRRHTRIRRSNAMARTTIATGAWMRGAT